MAAAIKPAVMRPAIPAPERRWIMMVRGMTTGIIIRRTVLVVMTMMRLGGLVGARFGRSVVL